MHDNLGNRMKSNYEDRSRPYLLRRTPVILRVDGKAFHTLTKSADKPFDQRIVGAMLSAATTIAAEMQGFKAGFVQSDEASFLLMDNDTIQTEAWFDYNQQKLVSVAASMMSVAFNTTEDFCMYRQARLGKTPWGVFDARAFNVPEETEVVNYFLWRAKDWERNSINMYARSFYSHKQLQGKSRAATLEMLEADGHRWNELPEQLKNGSWISRGESGIQHQTDIVPTFMRINSWVGDQLYPQDLDEEPLDAE